MAKARKRSKSKRFAKRTVPVKRALRKTTAEELFPDLPKNTAPKTYSVEPSKTEPTKPAAPPTEKEIRAVFADFGTPAKEPIKMPEEEPEKQLEEQPEERRGERSVAEQNTLSDTVSHFSRKVTTQISEIGKSAQQLWNTFRTRGKRRGEKPKSKAIAVKKSAVKLHRSDPQRWTREQGKMVALVAGCVLLFAFALFFAFNDREEPTTPPDTLPQNTTTPSEESEGSSILRVAWRDHSELCTPEFTARVLENAKTLGRKDGNTCAKLIAEGDHPRACLQINNLNYVALQTIKYDARQFNGTCQSQESFDAAVARAYFDAFERYARYPDIGYDSPAAEDFLIIGELPKIDIPAFQTMRCDTEWLRANRKELEHLDDVAALTGVVDEELKRLRASVAEMTEACR